MKTIKNKRKKRVKVEQAENTSRWWFVAMFLIALWLISSVVALFVSVDGGSESYGNVAIISIKGVIMTEAGDSLFGQDTVTSGEVVDMIERAANDDNIKALLLDINSPGGAPVPTKEIADAVKRVNKSTYAYIRDVGASGGYWIASACDKIVANEMSITGSIGVISSYLEFSGLLNDFNVSYQRLVSGEYKDIGAPFKKLEQDERELLEKQLELIHEIFIREVAENRKMSIEQVSKLANGMYYLGITAKELGLVDELGNTREVEEIIKNDLGLESVKYVSYKRSTSLLSILSQVFSEQSFYVGKGIGSQLVQEGEFSTVSVMV